WMVSSRPPRPALQCQRRCGLDDDGVPREQLRALRPPGGGDPRGARTSRAGAHAHVRHDGSAPRASTLEPVHEAPGRDQGEAMQSSAGIAAIHAWSSSAPRVWVSERPSSGIIAPTCDVCVRKYRIDMSGSPGTMSNMNPPVPVPALPGRLQTPRWNASVLSWLRYSCEVMPWMPRGLWQCAQLMSR